MSIPYFRPWVLQGLAAVIDSMGGDADAYATRFQLPLRDADDVDIHVPGERLIRLLEACAADLNCPDFGLRVGFAQGRVALGPIAIVGLNCETIGEAVAAIARFLNLVSTALELHLVQGRSGPHMAYELKVLRAGPSRQFEQWTLAVGLRMYKLIASDQAHLKAIHFPHTPILPLKFYTDFFGCPVRFGKAEYGIDLFASDLKRAVLRNDPELKRLIADYLEKIADPSISDLNDQVSLMVRKLLPTGRCNLNTVADHFNLSVRTLQRRLEQRGVVFEELVDAVRREAALRLLADPAVRLSQVAGLLGYAAQSSFSHAFRRWHGHAPREWRRHNLAA